MKNTRLIAVATAAFLMLTLAVSARVAVSAQANAATEQTLLQAENARFAAMHSADTAALDKLLAPELSYTHTSAAVQTKAQFISDIKTGTIKYLTIEPSGMKAHVYGTVGVITGGASVHIILNGKDMSFKIRYTDVHVHSHGHWQMVAWEATRVPDQN